MKVCLINNLYKPYNRGGAEAIVEAQKNSFEKLGHQVFVISTKPVWHENLAKHQKNTYYLPSLFLSLAKIPYFFRIFYHIFDLHNVNARNKIKNILEKEKPDLIITNNLKGLGLSTVRLCSKIKYHIHVLHDVQLLHPSGLMYYKQEEKLNGFIAKIYQAVNRQIFKTVKNFISPSSWLLDFHRNKNFFTNARSLTLLNPLPQDIERVKKKLSTNVFRILLISHISRSKGVLILLKALETLTEKSNKKIELIIAGKHFDKSIKLKSTVNLAIRKPKFYSHQELSDLLSQADCLVQPSLCYENSPTALYLAAKTATPIIASRIGGNIELVEKFGGQLYQPDSSLELAEKLYTQIKNSETSARNYNFNNSYAEDIINWLKRQ